MEEKNEALKAQEKYQTAVESANEYVENFDILETITNVGNDEVFTPRKTCDMILDSLPEEVWHNPNYKWLNPATKNGIFEREIAIRLDEGLKDIIPNEEKRRKHILQDMIYAIGQTKFTANVARRTLYYCSQANRKCDGIRDKEDGHFVNGYAIGNGTWFDDEEGNIKTPCTDHLFVKGKCEFCGISEDSKYNDHTQREKYAYEFIHMPKEKLLEHLQNRFFGGNRTMKFDIIIGNPPYQLDTKKDENTKSNPPSMPIYHIFFQQAVALKPTYISMIMPSKWFASGMSILDDFRQYMMTSGKIQSMTDYSNAKDCFPANSVAGGVCYFLWNSTYQGNCQFTNVINNSKNTIVRSLNEFPILVRQNNAVSILHKIRSFGENNMIEMASPTMPFGLKSDVRGDKTRTSSDQIKLISSNDETYISKNAIKSGFDYLDKYKVLIGILGAEHALEPDKDGMFRIITSSMRVLEPQAACTQSYFLVGKFDDFSKAEHLRNYLRTKFARFLILLAMTSTHLSRSVLVFLPKQNFDEDWNNKKCYEKYGLSSDEIALIEGTIKEMK